MKAFIYERVSSEEQARHGYSLDAQHEALTAFCEKQGHVIVGVYKDEGISARKPYTKRPAMLELLQDLETIKPDIILFTKLDRWFRNIKEYYKVQEILDRNKVNWKAINEEYDTSTASGRLYVNIKLSIAQDEADRTSERIKDVQSQLVAQGKFLGGSLHVGFELKDKRLVHNDDIKIVKDAIEHYRLHNSANSTTRYINDKYSLSYSAPRLLNLLKSPLLKGQYRNNLNFCDPVLTSEEWDALQEQIKRNIKHASKKRIYLFSGLLFCPHCGRRLGGVAMKNAKYYRCTAHYFNNCKQGFHVSEKKLEKWLLENVEEDFKVNVTMKPKQKREDPKKYKDRLDRLNEMYLLGNISQAEYKKKSAELQTRIAELQKIAPLKTQNLSADWKEVYSLLDEEHKRSFWHGLIKRIDPAVDKTGFDILY